MGTAAGTPAVAPSLQRHQVAVPGLEAGQLGGSDHPGGRQQSRLGCKSQGTKLAVPLKSGVTCQGGRKPLATRLFRPAISDPGTS